MLRFIRWLVGNDDDTRGSQPRAEVDVVAAPSSSPARGVSDAYFKTMQRMQAAVSSRDFEGAARHVRKNLQYITPWVKEFRSERRSFDISSIPALQQGGTVLALVGDDKGLARMREIVASAHELEPWGEVVERHRRDRKLFADILELVFAQPNCLQTDVKGLVGEEDGRRVGNLISYLEKAGKIVRVKSGRTYRLLPPDWAEVSEPPPKRIVGSHRTDHKPPRLGKIDVSSISYVPLPRSPSRWQDAHVGCEWATVPETEAPFEVRDADWKISTVAKLSPKQRPGHRLSPDASH